jgi:hypothetical protein
MADIVSFYAAKTNLITDVTHSTRKMLIVPRKATQIHIMQKIFKTTGRLANFR